MRKKFVLMMAILVVLMVPIAVFAEENVIIGKEYVSAEKIQVKLAECPLMINEQVVEHKNSVYPLLTYKGMLYFPMSWSYSRVLGIMTEWSLEEGFIANVENITAEMPEYEFASNSAEDLYGFIPDYSIKINGEKVENENLEYPIFNFRGTTYFPMTDDMMQKLGLDFYTDSSLGVSVRKKKEPDMINVVELFENTKANYGSNSEDTFIGLNSYVMEHQMCEDCMNCIQAHVMKLAHQYQIVPSVVDFTIELRMMDGDVPVMNQPQPVENNTDIIVYIE